MQDYKKTYRCHSDDGPPVCVQHGHKRRVLVLLLEHIGQGGEHDGAHAQQQEQEAQLLVVGAHRVAQGLQAGGVTRQFEDSEILMS